MPKQPSSLSRRQLVQSSAAGLALANLASLPAAVDGGSEVPDFERSCLRFRIDTNKKPPKTVSRKLPMTLNNVRMALDARAVITRKDSGQVFDYVLSASCKSEQVWVERDVWHQPNADMCMLAGKGEFLVYKRWDKADKGVMRYPASLGVQPERQLENPDDSFDSFSIHLKMRTARVLEDIDSILSAFMTDSPMVAETEYETEEYRVLLQYPVKVANFSERERYYQVDTGPVLLPDLDNEYKSLLEGCRLAYVAHNRSDWAEFIVCTPTPLTDTIRVHHYSQSVRIEGTKNRLFQIDVPA